jgi:hypothetical protein
MHLARIDLSIWAAGLVTHIVLLTILITRSRARTFPIFTTLISMNVARTVILYLIVFNHGSKQSYLVAYCSMAVLDMLLQLGVIYELASHTFRPVGDWAPDVRGGFIWAAGLSVAFATTLTLLPKIPPSHPWILSQLTRANFFSAMLMSELFVGMMVLSITLRLPWKPHAARIAQGFGVYSLGCVLIAAARSYPIITNKAGLLSTLIYLRETSYLFTVIYWIVSLWLDAPAPKELPEKMRSQLVILHQHLEISLLKLRAWK